MPADESVLPRQLSDPLLALRTFRAWLIVLYFTVLIGGLTVYGWIRGTIPNLVLRFAILTGCELLKLLWVWRILRNRVTNAFCLRSFKNDPDTWPIRKTAQAALGRRIRLSSIRNPCLCLDR